jgi:hypothetical protein
MSDGELTPGAGAAHPAFHAEDLAALAAVARGSEWLRGVACTLARRGVAFRQAHPARARAMLDALESSPLYKMGQFLFDLTEWEDFMVDGPPPPVMPATLDARALARLAGLLRQVQAHVEGNGAAPDGASSAASPAASPWPVVTLAGVTLEVQPLAAPDGKEPLPPLEAGFYLYQDVVLGVLRSVGPLLRVATPEG